LAEGRGFDKVASSGEILVKGFERAEETLAGFRVWIKVEALLEGS
jgi:hypothetical protein